MNAMLTALKKRLYFVVAAYFGFWARIVLWRWRPRVIVVTGSTGKTTVLHLIEAQLGDGAIYSHHANSAIGLPFFILGMAPNVTARSEWLWRLLSAPFRIFRRLPDRQLFIAEADCDRPGEGRFLAQLLKPEITLWVSVYRTHSMNFDRLIRHRAFKDHLSAIAYEFGHFAAATRRLILANGDQPVLVNELSRAGEGTVVSLSRSEEITGYQLKKHETEFHFSNQKVTLPGIHPQELGVSIRMVYELLDYLDKPFDAKYTQLQMPPGRSSIFRGKKDITIIDSTYNTGLGAMTAIIQLFDRYPATTRWLVLGDILEQGSLERAEHEGLAKVIAGSKAERVILLGPRTKRYTLPLLHNIKPDLPVESFERPDEVLRYLNENLSGRETVLFKGGRFLEGVIEQLLADASDAEQLVRREPVWVKRRQQWGLPR